MKKNTVLYSCLALYFGCPALVYIIDSVFGNVGLSIALVVTWILVIPALVAMYSPLQEENEKLQNKIERAEEGVQYYKKRYEEVKEAYNRLCQANEELEIENKNLERYIGEVCRATGYDSAKAIAAASPGTSIRTKTGLYS